MSNTLLPDISREFLTWMMEGKAIERIHIEAMEGNFNYSFETRPKDSCAS